MKWRGLLLTICCLSAPAWANDYCDTRQTARDYQQCYRLAIDTSSMLLKKTLDKAMTHAANDGERANIQKYHGIWWNEVRAGCGGDLKCIDNSVNARNALLIGDLYRRGIR